MIYTTQVKFSYKNISFSFPDISCDAGETLLITGASGKGKSTFLHLLAGLLKPKTGTIRISDTDITRLNMRLLDSFRGKHIGVVFQQSHYIASMNVWDNLMLASQFANRKLAEERTSIVLSELRLNKQAKQKPETLSIGQQQRLSIARAIFNIPSVLLADEPTSSLDDANCFRVAETLNNLARQNNTALLIVTHDQRLKEIFPRKIELI